MTIKGGPSARWNTKIMEQREELLVSCIEMRSALEQAKRVRGCRNDRKARFAQIETINLERAADEWRSALATLHHIGISLSISLANLAANSRIVIPLARRKWCEKVRDAPNIFCCAAELVDDHHRALIRTDALQLRSHGSFPNSKRERSRCTATLLD